MARLPRFLAGILAATLVVPASAMADPGSRADQRAAGAAPTPGDVAPAAKALPSPFRPASRDAGSGATARAAAGPPRAVRLSTGWEFRPGAQYEAGATGWQTITVPHVFDARPLAEQFPGTVAWYRLRFDAPSARSGFAFALRFQSVRRNAVVYLNGKRLGANQDPYTPFTLDARGLREGAQNELLVRVDNLKGRDPPEGWWNWGGIVRPVELIPRGRVTVSALGLIPKLSRDRKRATLRVDALIQNRTARRIAPRVQVTLRAPSGALSRQTFRLRSIAGRRTRQELLELPVKGRPELWSPDRPQLYSADVRVGTAGRTDQADRARIGMRKIEVRSGRLYLNGRPLQLRGAAMHEDMPGRGAALTDADVEQIVSDLKAVGADVTRTHYLFDERLLRRFDEEGILGWNETPVFQRDRVLKRSRGRSEALGEVKRTVVAARNHPSVLTNSVANELATEPDEKKGTRRYLLDAAALARKLDPEVPVSVAIRTVPGTPTQRTYRPFDLIGFNSYLGWYPCPPKAPTSLDQLRPFIAELRSQYPGKALLMSEFGAEATRDGPPTEKDTFAFQSDYVSRTLDTVDRSPELGGAIYWALREFAVRPAWDGGACRPPEQSTGIHRKGLLDYESGSPKPAWTIARDRFKATPLFAPR
ncbi:MAG: glycoside hydrolase family 2 protein [Solirubrobacteraceae bacterium]